MASQLVTQTPTGPVYTISRAAGEIPAVKDGNFIGAAGQNTSYAGADIVAAFRMPNGSARVFGSLQTVSYSTHRDPFLVRRLGTVNPAGFTVGHRTIAGSLIFTIFDKHALSECIDELYKTYPSGKVSESIGYNHLPDELPPFDIYIHLTNEFGSSSRFAILGVKISDDGSTFSINDLYTEEVFQFVALDIQPLRVKERESGGAKGWNDYLYTTLIDREVRYRVDRPQPIVTIWNEREGRYVPGDASDLLNQDVNYKILDLADPNILYPVTIVDVEETE